MAVGDMTARRDGLWFIADRRLVWSVALPLIAGLSAGLWLIVWEIAGLVMAG